MAAMYPNLAKHADIESVRASGIYYILNRGNNKIYVGQTSGIPSRLDEHIYHLNTHRHCNHRLQHDWDVFGGQAFEFGILAADADHRRYDQSFRDTRNVLERTFIHAYQSDNPDFGYNISFRGVKRQPWRP